jgi:hypothetical protein
MHKMPMRELSSHLPFLFFSLHPFSPLFRVHRSICNPNRRKICHRLAICIRIHRHALLAHGAEQLEVVDVVGGRESVEELGLFVERIGESMGGARWHRHVIARLGVDDRAVLAVEAQRALGHEEGLIVHFVPLLWLEEED